MRLEHVDRRVLGAVRFLDAATRLPITDPLYVDAPPGARLQRNRMGDYVIFNAPDLTAHTQEFLAPPAEPDVGDAPLEITVSDPAGQYLPQRVVIALPRNPDAAASNAIFRPIETPLYLAPAARTALGWAVVRATVVRAGSTQPLAGALLRVLDRSNPSLIIVRGRGLSDARGEALVAVPGIPVTNWNQDPEDEAVTTSKLAVTIETIFDREARGAPNPHDLEARRATLDTATQEIELASGQMFALTVSVTVP